MSAAVMWKPHDLRNTQMYAFMQYAHSKYPDLAPFEESYDKLYQWSVNESDQFWMTFFEFCRLFYSKPPFHAIEQSINICDTDIDWFPNCHLNYAENLLRAGKSGDMAIYAFREGCSRSFGLTFQVLQNEVHAFANGLRQLGVKAGDRVSGVLPNCPEAVIAYLASAAVGAIWSSASPDFGIQGIVQRLSQISPKVIFASSRTIYRGKVHDQLSKLNGLINSLVEKPDRIVLVPFLEIAEPDDSISDTVNDEASPERKRKRMDTSTILDDEYLEMRASGDKKLCSLITGLPNFCTLSQFLDVGPLHNGLVKEANSFAQLPFSHPLVIMFSSGTTGQPKCILHSAGGVLLKHLCEQKLHCDFRKEDRVFFLSNIGWMMWNWLISALATGCSIILYEGCPLYENLWSMLDSLDLSVLGTSAKWLALMEDRGVNPGKQCSLKNLRIILSTGSVLAPRSFDYIYRDVKSTVLLGSISGGTDMLGCCVGCCPILPVHRGQIQCRMLGMAVESWDDQAKAQWDKKGELVITRPFPSIPLRFYNDPDGSKMHRAYFNKFPDVWSHGDFIELHSNTQGVTITGRSDATLNPNGIRLGSAEIYNIIESLPFVKDSLCVAQSNKDRTDERMVLFVQLINYDINGNSDPKPDGFQLVPARFADQIRTAIRSELSPRFCPALMVSVQTIPYTLNGKKVEVAVRRLLEGVAAEDAFARTSLSDQSVMDLYTSLVDSLMW